MSVLVALQNSVIFNFQYENLPLILVLSCCIMTVRIKRKISTVSLCGVTPLNEGIIKIWVLSYGSQAGDPHYKCTLIAKCQTHILVMRSSWGVNMVSICTNWAKYFPPPHPILLCGNIGYHSLEEPARTG